MMELTLDFLFKPIPLKIALPTTQTVIVPTFKTTEIRITTAGQLYLPLLLHQLPLPAATNSTPASMDLSSQ
jgi:hypothetical protein